MSPRHRNLIVLGLVLAAVVLLVVGLCALLGPTDPIYNGKHLSYWLNQPLPDVMGTATSFQGRPWPTAHLGAKALPFLVDALESSDGAVRRRYAVLWPGLPASLQSRLPKPRNTARIRENALYYLLDLKAFNSPMVVPALARTIEKSRDNRLRASAAFLVGDVNSKEPALLQALVHGLQDNDSIVRLACTESLRQLDPARLPPNDPSILK